MYDYIGREKGRVELDQPKLEMLDIKFQINSKSAIIVFHKYVGLRLEKKREEFINKNSIYLIYVI